MGKHPVFLDLDPYIGEESSGLVKITNLAEKYYVNAPAQTYIIL